ncbi:MAG: putative manganese-dependent inorganic diphosphatase [Bacilli bacterium]|nr:putative manganese-dependent inorganic diphosphatase [Bacilli bacterium]
MDKIYIFGHKKPDADSVCGSITLSNLKNKLGMNTEPRILSPINKETEYILNRFNISVPEYLNDVRVQIKDVNYHKDYIINENESIYEAFKKMNDNAITGLPLVDDADNFKGYVSLKEVASEMIYNENLFIDTTFDNIASILETKDYIKFDNQITGYAHAATFDDETFIKDIELDEKSIVIVGDRETIIKHAINLNVKLIIMVKGKKLTEELEKEARKHKINVIMTNKSSFKIARVLCLTNPIKSIKRGTDTVTFTIDDYLTDFNEETNKLKHTNYPILNSRGKCLGMLRTIDAHEVTKKKVILVDHNMRAQSVDGLEEAEILEITDHHNIGDINTSSPINFRNMAVGAVNTIIYYLYRENNVKIDKTMASLMLSGIISDTLLLQSPTTTEKDRLVAKDLAHIAKLDLNTYGLELLSSGVSIEGLTANDILFKDFKIYKVGNYNMSIAQVFTTDFKYFEPRVKEIVEELNRVSKNHDYKSCVLFVTNFLTNNSYVLFSDNSKKILELAYGLDNIQNGDILKGVVSRKKQMVPYIMSAIEHN